MEEYGLKQGIENIGKYGLASALKQDWKETKNTGKESLETLTFVPIEIVKISLGLGLLAISIPIFEFATWRAEKQGRRLVIDYLFDNSHSPI